MKDCVLMHEHLTVDLSAAKGDLDCRLDCIDETISEFRDLRKFGVSRVVDVTCDGMGRNQAFIDRVERETGVQIVRSTGWYKEPFLPKFVTEKTAAELAEIMLGEIQNGFGGGKKAAMIGEIGTSKAEMKPNEKKIFTAAAIAHKETGVPIYTHTTLGTFATEQVAFFAENACDLSKIVIGHIDLCGNLDTILRVLENGVNVGFDTIGKNNYFPDEKRAEFLAEIEKRDLAGQVVLSQDLTRRSHLKANGGVGYCHIFTKFLPLLKEKGVSDAAIEKMLCANPKRILG